VTSQSGVVPCCAEGQWVSSRRFQPTGKSRKNNFGPGGADVMERYSQPHSGLMPVLLFVSVGFRPALRDYSQYVLGPEIAAAIVDAQAALAREPPQIRAA